MNNTLSLFLKKVLRIKLISLFVLTLMTITSFYFADNMPDHFLSISSSDSNINYFKYYIFSLIALVEYYSGAWIFFPFIVYSSLYAFVYSKRSKGLDLLGGPVIVLFFLSLFYAFSPEVLGEGVLYLLKEMLSFEGNLGIGVCLFVIAFWITFRIPLHADSFKGVVKIKTFWTKTKNILRGKTTVPLVKKDLHTPEKIVSSSSEETPSKVSEPAVSKKRWNDVHYKELVSDVLLKTDKDKTSGPNNTYFQEIIVCIEEKLAEFGIDGKIVNVLKGPVVDTFELQLGSGIKVAKIMAAEKDISMALLGASIRMVYPMVGRPTVGIEVPRNPREIIYLAEVIGSKDFQKSSYELPVAMGKDAFGETFIVDLSSMPHMLVAGSTGAGKSVFINSLLVSLLVKCSPKKMKLLLIDPKQLELALYHRLPHLVMPVLTEPRGAGIALKWAVGEMERRYSILREFGVRNVASFNAKVGKAGKDLLDKIRPFYPEKGSFELPLLVIVVDEFADLILSKSGKEIEYNICRLAAKARASGIHLVVATQRPSVDVVTGLIKSNFSTRVSFRVTSSIDSRTILAQIGAERLLGKGDMLYRYGAVCKRVHSAFVREEEIEGLAKKIESLGQTFYPTAMELYNQFKKEEAMLKNTSSENVRGGDDNIDELIEQAINMIFQYRTASTSMLQRRLKIGYNRAANLIEELESRGVIGPADSGGKREILIKVSHASNQRPLSDEIRREI